jgi:hypothetical protein
LVPSRGELGSCRKVAGPGDAAVMRLRFPRAKSAQANGFRLIDHPCLPSLSGRLRPTCGLAFPLSSGEILEI